MSRRILCLCTGGTICMQHTSFGMSPVSGVIPSLLKEKFATDELLLDIFEYDHLIDSSCITFEHWNQIIRDIYANYNYYDGFIILHGTDTMAYSASVLSFALIGLNKPVVLTGAQLPLLDKRSDAWINFGDALLAACQDGLSEVVLVFNRLMLRGSRARKVNTSSFNSFNSPNEEALALFDVQTKWQSNLWRRNNSNFSVIMLDPEVQVCSFLLTPGASVDLFAYQLRTHIPHGVILLSYGNGNMPKNQDFLLSIRAASDAGCLILNLTQTMQGRVDSGAYAAGQALAEFGAISGFDMTLEAALAKLTVLASQKLNSEYARNLLRKNIVGEMSI